jgi:AcrR family transcriptional regulator
VALDPVAEAALHKHGRVPRQVRERQVRAIAAQLFVERGYAGASMNELANRVGLSRPVLYDIAGSMAQLYRDNFERLIQEIDAQVSAAVLESSDLVEAGRAAILAYFIFLADHRAELNLVVFGSGDPELDKAIEELRSRSVNRLADLFTATAQTAGVDIDHRRIQALVRGIRASCEHIAHWRATAATDIPPETTAQWAVDLIEPGIRALLAESGTVP